MTIKDYRARQAIELFDKYFTVYKKSKPVYNYLIPQPRTVHIRPSEFNSILKAFDYGLSLWCFYDQNNISIVTSNHHEDDLVIGQLIKKVEI